MKKSSTFSNLLQVILPVLMLLSVGFSQESEQDKSLSPYFFIKGGEAGVDKLPLKNTEVKVQISGVIAEVRVKQVYKNEGNDPINARYIFPASTRAAVHGMTMKIGNKIIKAKIKEKQEAKKKFEEAKRKGKSASLLQQHRPNVFSMNVANIMPEDVIEIELKYTELLIPTDGIYEFVYPTVAGPRYSEGSELTADKNDSYVKSPYLTEDSEQVSGFNIKTSLSSPISIKEVLCSSHTTNIVWNEPTKVDVSLDPSETKGGNRDYIVKYRLSGNTIQSGLMLYEGEKENFFLLMAQPPKRVTPKNIPQREYIFVVDVSGSMHGFPLDVSKKLLKDLVGSLKPNDMFNVLLFAGGSNVLASKSLTASNRNIQDAIYFINSSRGGGGTRLLNAMKDAVALPKEENISRSIVLVTDGYISAEKQVFKYIHDNLDKTNVFCFGIGSSVNRYLIEGLAKAGQGEPFLVTKKSEARGQAKKFREYIESPVLTNISVDFGALKVYDVIPEKIPDVLAARPILIFGKWNGKTKGSVTLKGITGEGEYQKKFEVNSVDPDTANSPLKYLWARTKIATLSDYNFGMDSDENKKQIISLGLTYNLLTKFTSFLAILEKIRNPKVNAKNVNHPQPLPKGVSNLAVGSGMRRVPEPGLLLMLSLMLPIVFRTKFLKFFKNK